MKGTATQEAEKFLASRGHNVYSRAQKTKEEALKAAYAMHAAEPISELTAASRPAPYNTSYAGERALERCESVFFVLNGYFSPVSYM